MLSLSLATPYNMRSHSAPLTALILLGMAALVPTSAQAQTLFDAGRFSVVSLKAMLPSESTSGSVALRLTDHLSIHAGASSSMSGRYSHPSVSVRSAYLVRADTSPWGGVIDAGASLQTGFSRSGSASAGGEIFREMSPTRAVRIFPSLSLSAGYSVPGWFSATTARAPVYVSMGRKVQMVVTPSYTIPLVTPRMARWDRWGVSAGIQMALGR